MIDYKLAKELKEAGFPQEGEGKTLYWKSAAVGFSTCISCSSNVYAPTLSELIEACGEFNWKFNLSGNFEDNHWHAHSKIPYGGTGKTPEVAVAKLWLALNKKVEIVKGDDERLLKGIENMVPKKRIEGFETYLT